MAISDELNRIIQAKAGIKSALEEKGLTIGDSSTLDEYPALIQEMETGDGDGYPISTIIDLIERDITSIEIPNNTTKIGDYVFAGCNYLSSVTIPNTVTQIGAQAFQYCQGLHDITIPNSVITIGDNAFIQSGLSGSLYIPSSVTTIGNNAFKNCGSLTGVFIPSSVTTIGNSAFNTTNSSTDIVFLGNIPPALGNTTVFADTQMIYVKNAVVDTYKNAGGNWNDVSTIIQVLADISYNNETKTVQALGRNVELYIDSSLLDTSVYTFVPGSDDSSHIITVTSTDPSLGLVDSSTMEVLVEGEGGETPVSILSTPHITYDANLRQVSTDASNFQDYNNEDISNPFNCQDIINPEQGMDLLAFDSQANLSYGVINETFGTYGLTKFGVLTYDTTTNTLDYVIDDDPDLSYQIFNNQYTLKYKVNSVETDLSGNSNFSLPYTFPVQPDYIEAFFNMQIDSQQDQVYPVGSNMVWLYIGNNALMEETPAIQDISIYKHSAKLYYVVPQYDNTLQYDSFVFEGLNIDTDQTYGPYTMTIPAARFYLADDTYTVHYKIKRTDYAPSKDVYITIIVENKDVSNHAVIDVSS